MSSCCLMSSSLEWCPLAERVCSGPSHRWSSHCTSTAWCRRWGQLGFRSRVRTTAHPAAGRCTPSHRHYHSGERGENRRLCCGCLWKNVSQHGIKMLWCRCRQGGRMRKERQMTTDIKVRSAAVWSAVSLSMLTKQLSVFAWPAQTMPGLQNTYSGNVFMQVWSSTTDTVIHFRCWSGSSVSRRKKVHYYSDSFKLSQIMGIF